MELASNGFIVFAIDHHDGTCSYTENKKGDRNWCFDADAPWFDYEDLNKKEQIRKGEIKILIDEIFGEDFMYCLGFDGVVLDKEKLILAGHSMGAATMIDVANKDKRAKCLITLDPYLYPINKEIFSGKIKIKVPTFILYSETFHEAIT